ncbi:SDR family oxidoreductase [Actinoplanes sp. LDG1-06]|uniref:SDR family oxidoreductase n=1 Tax=Paractinoplanes ovalisporus TaxID=2810368 RepID=A0ABS2AKL9_9ACTN|nr:SDR family NAD(P)-dependent oxidoreductase [Actinoplanes ovalisporus]MBM2620366.1 SDR family oxidoreductase [Actinoplanes ovalisporus]
MSAVTGPLLPLHWPDASDEVAADPGPAPVQRFTGRTVVVSGGGRGIGRAVALAFAREGARVAVASRTTAQVDRVAAELRAAGADAVSLTCDVSSAAQVRATVRAAADRWGPPDILVNCAGVFSMGPSESTDEADARELFDTNALGTLLMCQEFGRTMLEQNHGRIVNFASLLSFTAFPQRAAYAASKGAVLQLTRVLGVEWASRGVRVNAVAPGMIRIETPHPAIAAGSLDEDEIVRRIPMGRRGRPEDVTGAVLFLASDEAAYITGQTLVVDGGWLSYGYL